ncbi:Tn3 family transposase [Streptosporangium canum]|uniref:Tn3 family transposase n=1 Tax=Streptosporangium canum TaxID=324952 RepID=UPI0033A23491
MTTLAKMVATARAGATALTWEKVAHLLTGERRGDLDRLLMYDAGLKMTRLAWLIIARQLNKGESLHALRRDLRYAQQGAVTKPALADQTDQAWCLTVLTNAVITWTTEYYSLAVRQLRATGRDVPDELLAHLSPAHSENINFFGVINVDVEAESAKLDGGGWRPLRPVATEMALM